VEPARFGGWLFANVPAAVNLLSKQLTAEAGLRFYTTYIEEAAKQVGTFRRLAQSDDGYRWHGTVEIKAESGTVLIAVPPLCPAKTRGKGLSHVTLLDRSPLVFVRDKVSDKELLDLVEKFTTALRTNG
jgi:hypothetical protein